MKIEVFIPFYNHEKFILNTVKSVINCQRKNLNVSIKIVNDGSDLNKLLEILKDVSLEINLEIHDSTNKGAFFQHIKAIRSSTADFLFFLNSDDTYNKNRIEYFVNILQDFEHAWSFSDVQVINESKIRTDYQEFIDHILEIQKENKSSTNLFKYNQVISTGNLVLKNPRYYSNIFSEFRLETVHDWYIARNLAMIENPVYVPVKLYNYQLHESNSITINKIESHEEGKILHFIEQQIISLGYFGLHGLNC